MTDRHCQYPILHIFVGVVTKSTTPSYLLAFYYVPPIYDLSEGSLKTRLQTHGVLPEVARELPGFLGFGWGGVTLIELL